MGIVGIKWKLVNGFWANLIAIAANANVAKLKVWSTNRSLVRIIIKPPCLGTDVVANVYDKTILLTKKMSKVTQ
jgi:hypothetical protein